MKEVWKDIKDYEGRYQISNFGRVKSLAKLRGGYSGYLVGDKIMTPIIVTGYYQIGIRQNGVRKYFKIHRLIAFAFIPNKHNYPIINHKDSNRLNNKVSNLEWCTYKQNTRHAINYKRKISWDGLNNPKSKLKIKDVLYIRNSDMSAVELSKKFNIASAYVYYIKNFKVWKHL